MQAAARACRKVYLLSTCATYPCWLVSVLIEVIATLPPQALELLQPTSAGDGQSSALPAKPRQRADPG